VAYVSLFGKETISSIRTDIFLQVISKKKKAWHATAKHIKDISFKIITTLQFFCSFSSDISPRTSSNSIDDDSLSKSVSLFGKETISSIRTDIFLQVISKKQKAWYFLNF
jgi:hypothetical protein